MEFPSFNHHPHHNRYPHPPPPLPMNFSDDRPNLYPHHHHLLPSLHLPPPPPLAYPSLPPPPPPPLPVPPPPPSYNPHQSHFTFLDAQNPPFLNHGRSSPPQPRFSNQSQRFDYGTDTWSDSHTVPPEPPHRNPILPDEHHRRLYAPNPRSENPYKPHVSERVIPSNRYRDETNVDGFGCRDNASQEQQAFRGNSNNDERHGRVIDRYPSARPVMDMDKATGSNSRNLEEYEPRYMTNSEEERIWDRHGEDPKRGHQMKGKKSEFGQNVSQSQSRDYEYESSRNPRAREGREEYKQVQKKSVLLRIGKPKNSHRNRSHDQHFSKVESNNSNLNRGKDKDKDSSLYVEHRKEGDREQSPVELDVSFKSNALVAKAVVTPSSPAIDNNNTQIQSRNRKIKRAIEFDSPLTRDSPSSSEKAPKQQKVKDFVNGGDPVVDQGGGGGGPKPLSFRLRKKRKLINFKNSPSTSSIFQLAEKDEKSVKGGEKKNNSPSASIIPSSLGEVIVSKLNMVSEKDSSEVQNPSLDDISSDENKAPTAQNEASLNDGKVSLDGSHVSPCSSRHDQIEIQKCSDEIFTENESAKTQETSTSADMDPCSDENSTTPVAVVVECVLRKEEESLLLEGTKFSEDDPNVVSIDEDVEICTPVAMKGSETQLDFGEKHENVCNTSRLISSDEDEDGDVEIVDLISPSVEIETQSPEPSSSLLVKDASSTILSPDAFVTDDSNSDKTVPDMPVTSQKVSGFLKDETISNSISAVIPDNDENICEKLVSKCPEASIKTSSHTEVTTKTALAFQQGLKSQGLNTSLPMKKPRFASTVFATSSSLPVFTNPRIPAKPRTWHRAASNPASSSMAKASSVSVPQPPKQTGTVQSSSYIRSGNTLVRKGGPAIPTSRSTPSGPTEARTSHTRTAGSGAAVVRPKTPPLSGGTKLPDSTTISSLEHLTTKSNRDEDENSSLTLAVVDEGKKIQYVKRKSNQLVAAPASTSVQETPTQTQDGYYKRRKNQLIRTSTSTSTSTSMLGDDSDLPKSSKISIKRHSGIYKKYRNLRVPSVWTLGSQSLGKDGQKLFPWKRPKYLGNAIHSNSSSSLISRKLLLSRKREMVYTRSKHGFSLRMSKLLSVGGSSLKWSKSIERNSKRANEEATLAVAAAEKKRREQHLTTQIKTSRNNNRDRIFRIGLVRYKMDPSRRTLQRISDEDPSTSMQSKQETKRSYVPKRLLIGHDEYVRIGNGNQLVRNPKRRTRMFANEKVRWSLHTARSRLAKKKKYCQFFTRFGKCNKDDDGKCPYIHDSSKIAVCTKFLNGLCSNAHCNLTHKVIPERMQDCSYFLQGLCSNEHCPYRHVNVNSAASICEGFLKGYCADGNECRKKHTYACPVFEATGECSQGTKCKLLHPKNRNKRRKPHHNNSNSNSRGRYFGAASGGGDTIPVSETESHHFKDDILCQQGKFAEYISLDFGNEEEFISDETTMVVTSDNSDLGQVDLDDQTKPIGIMKRFNLGLESDSHLT